MADDMNEIRIPFSMTIPAPPQPESTGRFGQRSKVLPGEGPFARAKQIPVVGASAAVTRVAPAGSPETFGLPAAVLAARVQWIGRVQLYSVRSVGRMLVAAGTADAVLGVAAPAGAVVLEIWGRPVFFAAFADATRYLRGLLETGVPG